MFDAILVIAFVVIYLTTVWYYERRLEVLDELLVEAHCTRPHTDDERPMLRYLSERQRAEQPFNVIDLTKGK